MGFHKRYIDNEQVIDIYTNNGCQAVIDWYTKGADAIITEIGLASNVYNLIERKYDWNELSMFISKEVIKKGIKK